jgi:Cof subfamily protein (haloacid dehalogenase superfamily)
MTSPFQALVLDIDGTLLDGTGTLTDRTARALRRATEAGLRLFLATGRSVPGALPVHRQLAFQTPLICFNGLVIYDPPADGWLQVLALPEEALETLTGWALELADFFLVTTRDTYAAIAERSPLQRTITNFLDRVDFTADDAGLPRRGVVKVQCFCTPERRPELVQRVEGSPWADRIHIRDFPLQTLPGMEDFPLCYVDLEPTSRGKAEALDFLKRTYDIDAERVVAVGDQVNDLAMVRAAGLGVAMGQGSPELKAEADHVAGPNTDDGLARFIEGLLDGTIA